MAHPAVALDRTFVQRFYRDPVKIFRVAVVAVLLVFAATTPGFLSTPSIRSLLNMMSMVGCVAVGMTFITLSGNIMSFSLGMTLSATTIVFVPSLSHGLGVALLIGFVFSAVISGLQGWIIGFFRANPIIISMAAMALIVGVAVAITGGHGVYILGDQADVLVHNVGPLPAPLVGFMVCVVVGQLILSFTHLGRNLYMVGSNPRAAKAAGIPIARTVTWCYLLAGVFTAVTAVQVAARYSSGDLQHGIGYDYQAISAVLVGGNAIQGGQGSVLRTLVGAFLVTVFQGLLILRGFSTEMQHLLIGVVVLAVIMMQWKRGE